MSVSARPPLAATHASLSSTLRASRSTVGGALCGAALPSCSVGVTMIIIVTSCRPAASFEQTTPDTERARVTMRTRSFADMSCSIAGALELVGDRWTLLIVRDLLFGLSRFDDLQRSTGIPPQTLADRLRRLEASKVITKHR